MLSGIANFSPSKKSNKTDCIVKISKNPADKISAKGLVSTVNERECGGNAELARIGCNSNDIITAISNYLAR